VVSRMTVTRSSMIENTSVAPTSFDGGDPAAGTVIATVPFPQGFGTRSEINVITGRADASSSQRFDVHTPQLGTSADVDLGTLALPWITGLTLAPNGATWTTVEAGASPDGMLVQWLGRWNDGTRPVTITWRVAQPVAAAGMTLPALPKAYAALDPTQQTVEVTPTRVNWTVVDYEDLAGYDAFRQMADTLVVLDTSSVGAFVGQPYRRHITTQQVPQRLPIPVPGPKQ
jgi:hypothetical protein